MLDITFPDAVDDELRALLDSIPPGYTLNDRPATMRPAPNRKPTADILTG